MRINVGLFQLYTVNDWPLITKHREVPIGDITINEAIFVCGSRCGACKWTKWNIYQYISKVLLHGEWHRMQQINHKQFSKPRFSTIAVVQWFHIVNQLQGIITITSLKLYKFVFGIATWFTKLVSVTLMLCGPYIISCSTQS